jgi:anti-sigma-K factor RskA
MSEREDDEGRRDDRVDDLDLGALPAMLADPELWTDPDPALADAVVEAVAQQSGGDTTASPPDGGVGRPGSRRRWAVAALAAAAVVLLVAGVVLAPSGEGGGGPEGVEVALDGTELAPGATATAVVADTPPGTRIDLSLEGLPAAPAGAYYEAWMWDGEGTGVSAGTFHLRGGTATIELWSGVSPDEYPRLSVTLQEEGQAEASALVVLTDGRGS